MNKYSRTTKTDKPETKRTKLLIKQHDDKIQYKLYKLLVCINSHVFCAVEHKFAVKHCNMQLERLQVKLISSAYAAIVDINCEYHHHHHHHHQFIKNTCQTHVLT